MKYSAVEIANSFIQMGIENHNPITHMQLQKLLYYSQGWFLALTDKALFDEDFKKWAFGPVCPPVYNKLKKHKGSPLTATIANQKNVDDESIYSFLLKIWEMYGKYTGAQLSTLSHKEAPWINADEFGLISKDSLKEYFQSRLSHFK